MKQFEWAMDRKKSLTYCRCLVLGKIKNCRTQVRRNDPESPAQVLEKLDRLSKDAKKASNIEKLLGIEGAAAEVYFGRLDGLLKGDQGFLIPEQEQKAAKRSSERRALISLRRSGQGVICNLAGGGLRPIPRILSPAQVRPSCSGPGHDGGVSAIDRGLNDCDHSVQ